MCVVPGPGLDGHYFLLVAKGRPLTQSGSLLKMARLLTLHHCGRGAHHDQHAAERSQKKMLTTVSPRPESAPATTVARPGPVPGVIQGHAARWGLNYGDSGDRRSVRKDY